MLRDTARFVIWFELIFVIAFFALAVIPRSPVFETYQADALATNDHCHSSKSTEEEKAKDDCKGFLYRTLNDPVALFTGLLFAATIALFMATYWLFRIAVSESEKAETALRIAEISAEASQTAALATAQSAAATKKIADAERAWVLFKGVNALEVQRLRIDQFEYPVGMVLSVTWMNAGRSPAIDARTEIIPIFIDFHADAPEADVTNEPIPGTGFPIPTGATINTASYPYDNKCRDDFVSYKKKWVVYSKANYRLEVGGDIKESVIVVEVTFNGWQIIDGNKFITTVSQPIGAGNRAT